MAVLTVKRAELYPAGTKVKVYALPTPRPGGLRDINSGDPGNWKPALSKKAELTVTSEGVLEGTIGSGAGELPEKTPLLCWAEVGGKDVYLTVRADGSTQLEPV